MIPALVTAIAISLSGHPVSIDCDTSTYPGPPPPAPYVVEAWTYTGGDVIHMRRELCEGFSFAPGTRRFAQSIRVLIHESAHARGIRSEACAELHAQLGVFDVLRRFYRISFFSSLSRLIGEQVYLEGLKRPANYQPSFNSCSGG
jgi:hypothetical protein